MQTLGYAKVEYRENEDGFVEKCVYVPVLDEWMTEEEFICQKACYDPAMEDARIYEQEHGSDDIIEYDDDIDAEEEDYEDYDDDGCSVMTREEAMEEYENTGINNSEFDLNDWDDINDRLGYVFYDPKK